MIRIDAGMPRARFCALIGVPERSWRRWQARARVGERPKGPWPVPVRDAIASAAREHALAHPAWGHRKIWALVRHDGLESSPSTVMRSLRDQALLLPAEYQRQRRRLGKARRADLAKTPAGANEVWQLDFTDFETSRGGTWRVAGCRDCWSRCEHPFHLSPTANQHDAIDALELARHLEERRRTHSELRPHEALAWSCPAEVH